MEEEVDRLDDIDVNVLDEDMTNYVKQQMRCDFPVERIRKLTGKYTPLVSYYVENRLNMYFKLTYMFKDLAEVAYADFMHWTERDFKRVDASLLRNLRDHLANNGILVERKARLAISRALSDCLKDPDNIPMSEDTTLQFCEIRPRSNSRRSADARSSGNSNGSQSVENSEKQNENDQINSGSHINTPLVRAQSDAKSGQARLTDVAKCISKEMKYSGLPDEDFDEKVEHFKAALELSRVSNEQDKVIAIPCFLQGQAASTYRNEIKSQSESLEQSLSMLKAIFLSEEARRANDNIWDALSVEYIKREFSTVNMRDTLRRLFSEIERLRNCTSHAAKADEIALEYITRAKLLSAVSGITCFKHVRASPPSEYLRLRGSLYDAATQYDTGATRTVSSKQKAVVSPEVFYTDRRFRGKSGRKGKNQNISNKKRYAGNSQTCWVCDKDGCHSSNHDRNERKSRKHQFRNYLANAFQSSSDENAEESNDEHAESDESDTDGSSFATVLCTNSFLQKMGADPTGYDEFFGIALDTCCTRYCTSSLLQYQAYCRFTGQSPNISKKPLSFNTSGGVVQSIGYAWIHIPFGRLKELLKVKMHLFDHPSAAPMLLSYDVMKNNKWDMVISARRLQSSEDINNFVEYSEIHGLPVYQWKPQMNSILRYHNTESSLYTVQELRNIHRRTGHPSVGRLMKILESSPQISDLRPGTRSMLKRIMKSCKSCQKTAKPPERFRFVIHDESQFNHEVLTDIFKLSDGYVLHVMCSGTKYQLGRFIQDFSAKTCWEAIRIAWIDILSGAPDIIKADAGRQFASKEFKDSASTLGIHVEIVPTEAHNKIGLIERYHAIVRKVYEKLKCDSPDMSPESRLSIVFRCVNDTAGFDGIVPTLLVFGTYPKISNEPFHPAPTTVQRAKAVRIASQLSSELISKERIKRASKNGPSVSLERIDQVKRLSRNAPVLVYREKDGWVGPLKFVCADDHGAWIINDKGNEIRVSINVIKPYIPEQWTLNSTFFSKAKSPLFAEARKKEIAGLESRNVWKLVHKSKANGHRIYFGSWVELVKPDGTHKSRMVVCATNDFLDQLTYSPTVQRLSTRLAFAYGACRPDLKAKCRDVTQAFIQSGKKLRRPVFLELPHEMSKGNENMLLMIEGTLYGLPESPLNWFSTYTENFKNKLGMTSAPHDPCLLLSVQESKACDGFVLLQVDDSTAFGTDSFHAQEEKAASRFDNHGAKELSENPITHNGARLTYDGKVYSMNQSENVKRVERIPKGLSNEAALKALKSQNATAAYPASLTRPDLLCHTSKFSQVTKAKYSDTIRKRFNKFVDYCHSTLGISLRFVPLDLDTLHLAVFTDASFSTTGETNSHLGIVILLRDAKSNCNVVHTSSTKAKRLAKSVLGAEMFSLLDGFDVGYVLRHTLSKMMAREVDLHILTDSRTAYHITTTLIQTKEKRLMLDVHMLREAYEKREITKISWISGKSNIADCLTKMKHNGSLKMVLETNKCEIQFEGWVDRDLIPVHALKTHDHEHEIHYDAVSITEVFENRNPPSVENFVPRRSKRIARRSPSIVS